MIDEQPVTKCLFDEFFGSRVNFRHGSITNVKSCRTGNSWSVMDSGLSEPHSPTGYASLKAMRDC